MVQTESNMLELGTQAPSFRLLDTATGKQLSYDDVKGEKGTLVVFTCNHCPYAQAVEDRLIQIGAEYGPKGVNTVLISSNNVETHPDDSPEKMAERAKDKQYPFPYLYDADQSVAMAYQAACTPDPFLFDGERKLVYRGRIDDNWREPENVRSNELRDAIDAMLRGEKPNPDQKPSLGCNIKWKE